MASFVTSWRLTIGKKNFVCFKYQVDLEGNTAAVFNPFLQKLFLATSVNILCILLILDLSSAFIWKSWISNIPELIKYSCRHPVIWFPAENLSQMVVVIRAPAYLCCCHFYHFFMIFCQKYSRNGWRHPCPRRLASAQDQDLRLQPGHGVCLLQGVSGLEMWKFVQIFAFSPWSTMWTQKSDRESFSSDRSVNLGKHQIIFAVT